MNEENSAKNIILNGLLKRNPILISGTVIAPVVVTANCLSNAVTLAAAFSFITFFTLLVTSFVPKNIVYSIRIILYVLIGALVYAPAAIMFNYFMPGQIEALGVFFPLLIANGMIIYRSEAVFFQESKGHMMIDIIFSIIGYDLAVVLYGFIREILGRGTVWGTIIGMPVTFPALDTTFGGFMLLGAMAAITRVIVLSVKRMGQK